MNPFNVVRDFERALCEYTGAPYCVTTTSCTMALMLAVAFELRHTTGQWQTRLAHRGDLGRQDVSWIDGNTVAFKKPPQVQIPKRTYVGVPYAIREAGGCPTFRDEDWSACGYYRLAPLTVVDSARYFTSDLYRITTDWLARGMVCVSFHWNKTLGIQQGGAILHHDEFADEWLRRARFDGRKEGVAPKDDTFPLPRAWHAYMSPETAAAGLVRLANLPRHNAPIPADEYPDLSQLEAFR